MKVSAAKNLVSIWLLLNVKVRDELNTCVKESGVCVDFSLRERQCRGAWLKFSQEENLSCVS